MRTTGQTNVASKTFIAAAIAFGLTIVGFESLRPHANAAVAVVFPPWVDAGAAVDRAAEGGASLPHAGRYSFVAVVADSSPRFRQRVRQEGALLVLDAGKLGGYLGEPAQAVARGS